MWNYRMEDLMLVGELEKNIPRKILELKNVNKHFNNKSGIKDISFKVEEGEFVAFIGDNGVGKTTTIKCMLGDYLFTKGTITFDNENLHDPKIMKHIAFFPDQNNFPKNIKILDYAFYSANLKDIRNSDLKRKIKDFLLALDLEKSAHKKFSELSAGMQKRALLLSTLISNPKIIILDEPTANLDIKSRIEFMNLLYQLNKTFKITVIITSHNIDELNNFINRVILMTKDGQGFGTVVYDHKFNNEIENLKDIYMQIIGNDHKTIDYMRVKELMENEFS